MGFHTHCGPGQLGAYDSHLAPVSPLKYEPPCLPSAQLLTSSFLQAERLPVASLIVAFLVTSLSFPEGGLGESNVGVIGSSSGSLIPLPPS